MNIKPVVDIKRDMWKLKYQILPASVSVHFHHILSGHNLGVVIIIPFPATYSPQKCKFRPPQDLNWVLHSFVFLKFIDASQPKWKETGRSQSVFSSKMPIFSSYSTMNCLIENQRLILPQNFSYQKIHWPFLKALAHVPLCCTLQYLC